MELHDALSIIKKWLPYITQTDKDIIRNILLGSDITPGTILLKKYVKLLRPYAEIIGFIGKNNKPREDDCAASGIVFFYGCLFYIMHFPNWGSHIEDILLYNILYILVDHYIDDHRIDNNTKNIAISQMFLLINNPLIYLSLPLIDPTLETIAVVYHKLITRHPKTSSTILKLFQSEITGISIQTNNSLDRNNYYTIASMKGGHTMLVLQSIIDSDDPIITNESFKLGQIMQLLDDVSDVLSDKENGIHTIATHDLENKGCLDDLWIDIVSKINDLGPQFTIFKILYTLFAVYIPDRYRGNFSEKLWLETNKVNLFDYHYGCDAVDLLVKSIMDELNSD